MTNSEGPKPGPHLHQPPTLAELAGLHARAAHEALTNPAMPFNARGDRARAAEAHAAVARACAHAAIANRPPLHYRNGASR